MTPEEDAQRNAISQSLMPNLAARAAAADPYARYRKPTQYGYGAYAKGAQSLGEALADTAPMRGLREGVAAGPVGQALGGFDRLFAPRDPAAAWMPPPKDI